MEKELMNIANFDRVNPQSKVTLESLLQATQTHKGPHHHFVISQSVCTAPEFDGREMLGMRSADPANYDTKVTLESLLQGKQFQQLNNKRERSAFSELSNVRNQDVVNPQSRQNLNSLLAGRHRVQNFETTQNREEVNEVQNLKNQDLVNPQSQNHLNTLLAGRHAEFERNKKEQEELQNLQNKDPVNENSKVTLEGLLAGKHLGRFTQDEREEAERQELQQIKNNDPVNATSISALNQMMRGRAQFHEDEREEKAELQQLEKKDPVNDTSIQRLEQLIGKKAPPPQEEYPVPEVQHQQYGGHYPAHYEDKLYQEFVRCRQILENVSYD